jgi:hypothetical protein
MSDDQAPEFDHAKAARLCDAMMRAIEHIGSYETVDALVTVLGMVIMHMPGMDDPNKRAGLIERMPRAVEVLLRERIESLAAPRH